MESDKEPATVPETDNIESSETALVNEPEKPSDDDDEKKPVADDVVIEKVSVKRKKTLRLAGLFFMVCLALLFSVGSGYVVYMGSQSLNILEQQVAQQVKQQAEALSEVLSSVDGDLTTMIAQQQNQKREFDKRLMDVTQRLKNSEDRLHAQNKRLLAMSTTSREDWLLAEAEYLLKLANQRVLVERSAESAIGLLQEADSILRDLSDPDLFSLRQAIQDDLASLKLVEKIDIEGLYLELAALAKQVERIPVVPGAYRHIPTSESPEQAEAEQEDISSLQRFFLRLKGYVRYSRNSEVQKTLLPPDASAYLQLNLRMAIEQAQLALLKEQKEVYLSSLEEAQYWIARYFPSSVPATQFNKSLRDLQKRKIVKVLPDITLSLELLHTYIETLHKLGGSDQKSQRKEGRQ